jgi:GNAT superfamily N-acetyltransferase
MFIKSPKTSKIIVSNPDYKIVNSEDREFFFQDVNEVLSQSYPRFLIEDFVDSEPWNHLCSLYPEFQFGLVEVKTQKMVAQGSCLPIPWHESLEKLPNTGCDWALKTGLDAKLQNITPTILSAASIAILPEYQGQGLSQILLDYMQELARSYQYPTLILAARPTLKHLYPLTPIGRYINWENKTGFSFDPWLRMNLKRGARLIGICDRSTVMDDTIGNWERLTQMRFPETGSYIIQGAIAPLEVNCESDRGTYIEPNVWLSYTIS